MTCSTEGGLKIIYPPHGTVTGLMILNLRKKTCILLLKTQIFKKYFDRMLFLPEVCPQYSFHCCKYTDSF